MGAPAVIELHPEGAWNPGSTSGEWSQGGCGCGSELGSSCSCGACGCKGGGKICSGDPTGVSAGVVLRDYEGDIQSSVQPHGGIGGRCESGAICSASQWEGGLGDPWAPSTTAWWLQDPTPKKKWEPVYVYDDCFKKCEKIVNIIEFSKCMCCCWAAGQKTMPDGWRDSLPPCPCTVPIGSDDPPSEVPGANGTVFELSRIGRFVAPFHPGATWELRQKVKGDGPGQQCTYDAAGNLITGGAAAGTPDISSPTGTSGGAFDYHTPWKDHMREDVQPFTHCKMAGMVNCYLCHRPPNNALKCKENIVPADAPGQPAAKPDCDECKKNCGEDKVK